MNIKDFIVDFADQFDETELSEFKPDTKYREFDEWTSLTALAILSMIKKKYGVNLTASEVKDYDTVESLYNLILSKQ